MIKKILSPEDFGALTCPICKPVTLLQFRSLSEYNTVYITNRQCETDIPYLGYKRHYNICASKTPSVSQNYTILAEDFFYFGNEIVLQYSIELRPSSNSMSIFKRPGQTGAERLRLPFIPNWNFGNEDEIIAKLDKDWKKLLLMS